MTHPLLARAHLEAVAVAAMDDAREPLCRECHASFRRDGDTLCEACRYDVDETYAELRRRTA